MPSQTLLKLFFFSMGAGNDFVIKEWPQMIGVHLSHMVRYYDVY
jgi:hypothetical protein